MIVGSRWVVGSPAAFEEQAQHILSQSMPVCRNKCASCLSLLNPTILDVLSIFRLPLTESELGAPIPNWHLQCFHLRRSPILFPSLPVTWLRELQAMTDCKVSFNLALVRTEGRGDYGAEFWNYWNSVWFVHFSVRGSRIASSLSRARAAR